MRHQFARPVIFAIALLLSVSLCFDEASAQRKRNKRSRRITNPVAVTPVAEPQQPTTLLHRARNLQPSSGIDPRVERQLEVLAPRPKIGNPNRRIGGAQYKIVAALGG